MPSSGCSPTSTDGSCCPVRISRMRSTAPRSGSPTLRLLYPKTPRSPSGPGGQARRCAVPVTLAVDGQPPDGHVCQASTMPSPSRSPTAKRLFVCGQSCSCRRRWVPGSGSSRWRSPRRPRSRPPSHRRRQASRSRIPGPARAHRRPSMTPGAVAPHPRRSPSRTIDTAPRGGRRRDRGTRRRRGRSDARPLHLERGGGPDRWSAQGRL